MSDNTYQVLIVDKAGMAMCNFPMIIHHVGQNKKLHKLTDSESGTLTFTSDGTSNVDIFILAPMNADGTPNPSKMLEDGDSDYSYYRIGSVAGNLKLYSRKLTAPYMLSDYGIANSTFTFYENRDSKKLYDIPFYVKVKYFKGPTAQLIDTTLQVKNGTLKIRSILHSGIKLSPFKPDNTPFKYRDGTEVSADYFPRFTEPKTIPVYLDVVVTKGVTDTDKPTTNQDVKSKVPLITMEQMKKMWPAVKDTNKLQVIVDELNKGLTEYKLDTRLRQAHFMAQVFAETGDQFKLKENIAGYSEKTLLRYMGYYQKRPLEAKIDAAIKDKVLKEQTICNKAYMDKNRPKNRALGNIYEGDGYKYIGRGLKQLTGRYNYTYFDKFYKKAWPDEQLNFVENPELVEQPKYAVRTALVYWIANKLYALADKGPSDANVDQVTKGINAGATPDIIAARRLYFRKSKTIFV